MTTREYFVEQYFPFTVFCAAVVMIAKRISSSSTVIGTAKSLEITQNNAGGIENLHWNNRQY